MGDVEEGYQCSLLLVPDFDYEFTAHRFMTRNQTPNNAGWENELHTWVQAIDTIDGVFNQIQAEKLEAMKTNK